LQQWTVECEAQLTELSESFEKSIELLTASYDKYMASFTPAPQFLPVTVNIHVPSKNLRLQNVLVSPTDTVKEIKEYLRARMEKIGDPIVQFERTNIFVLSNSPLGHANAGEVGGSGAGGDDKSIILRDEGVPIVQFHPEPGASLVLQGKLKCKSDAPKECFKSIYQKDKQFIHDYYTCKDCKTNWICKSCVEVCHKGHNTVDYIQKHSPTWACCYCVKTAKCVLFHKEKE